MLERTQGHRRGFASSPDADAVQIALALRVAPREQTVTAQNNAFGTTILGDRTIELDGELKSGPLPRQPNDLASKLAIKFLELVLAIRAGSERDGPVRVQMIHVIEWKECVQRCVYGCSYFVIAESRKWIVTDHLIFVGFPAVQTFELFKAVKIKDRKT